MAQGYLAQVQALIAQRMKENPEEMKRKLKEIEEAKNKAKEAPKSPPKPSIDPQLTQKLIEELNKRSKLDIQKVKDLIKRGADIKPKSKYETTVLHWASYFGDIELSEECLQAGIDVNVKDNIYGETPLHWALLRNNIEIAKLLIDSGAKVNAKNNEGFTSLYLAESEEMEALLKQHGAE
jgi:ankyrin repeat protein